MKKSITLLAVAVSLICIGSKNASANPLGGLANRFKPASKIAGKLGNTFSKGGKMLRRTFSPRPNSPSYLSEYSESVDSHGYVWVSSNTGNNRRTSKRARLGYYSNGKAFWSYAGKRWRADSKYDRNNNSGVLGRPAAGDYTKFRKKLIRTRYEISRTGMVSKITTRGSREIARKYVGHARLQRMRNGQYYWVANGVRRLYRRR